MKSLNVKQAIVAAAIASVAFVSGAQAHGKKHCNFIPANNLKIAVGTNLMGGLSEAEFNKVIDNVSSFYAPIIQKKGGKLKVNRLWTDGTVNASAERKGKTWVVNMYGGLARHQVLTTDGFTLVMCHELGHHLGGFPKSESVFGDNWASNEGEADYFATMKCGRRVFENEDNGSVVQGMSIPASVTNKCSNTFKSTKEIALCQREAMAGMNLATLLWNISQKVNGVAATSAQPDFDTPDQSQVSKTDDAHPAAQCRLDTYYNGSVCGVSFNEDFGDDAVTGACAEEKGDKLGFRPRCWYKPSI